MDNMTKQRYISTSIWSDDWFDGLSEREKLVYFYFLTNEHTNSAGVYQCSLKQARLEIGIDRAEIERVMAKFGAARKAFYFEGYIIIPRWMKHQKIKERGKLRDAAQAVLKSLPLKIKKFVLDMKNSFDFEEYKEFQALLEDAVAEDLVTTAEACEGLEVSRRTFLSAAKQVYPAKVKNGVTTLWSEEEVAAVITALGKDAPDERAARNRSFTSAPCAGTDLQNPCAGGRNPPDVKVGAFPPFTLETVAVDPETCENPPKPPEKSPDTPENGGVEKRLFLGVKGDSDSDSDIDSKTHTPCGPVVSEEGVCVDKNISENKKQGGRGNLPESGGGGYDKYAALHPGYSPPDFSAYEEIRAAWNQTLLGVTLPQCRVLPVNMTYEQRETVSRALSMFSVEEINNAIENYIWMRMPENGEKVTVCLRFLNMFNFLEKALESFFRDDIFNETYNKDYRKSA